MRKQTGFERLLAVVGIALFCLLGFPASTALSEELSQPVEHVFDLEYVPSGFSLQVPMVRWLEKVTFEREPDFGQRDIVRGLLPTGLEERNFVGFAWDRSEGKLYLDLNRNRDLTDDPDGVFQSGSTRQYQTFEGIGLEVQLDSVRLPYVIRMTIYDFGRGGTHCNINVVSGFSAEIELYGERWYLAVVDNMDGKLGRGDNFVLKPVNLDFGLGHEQLSLSVPETVFFDGRNCDLSFEFQPGETKPSLRVTLTELERPMGQLDIEGKFISRLVLEAGSSLVLLDLPEESVSIPADNYRCRDIYLYDGQVGLFRAGNVGRVGSISVRENESVTLKIGAPLNNAVEVKRTGNILTLNYKLVGEGGQSYEALRGRSENPPTFAIYKGDKEIASGKFEYG